MNKVLTFLSIKKYELMYLMGAFCSILSYDLARTFAGLDSKFSSLNGLKTSLTVMFIFLYADVLISVILIVLSPIIKKKYKINLFSLDPYKKNTKLILGLIFIVTISMSKSFLANGYTTDILIGYDCISTVLSLLFIKFVNKAKITSQFLGMFIVAILGFIVFNYEKIGISFELVLLFYSITNSMSTSIKRKMSEYRDYINAVIFDNLAYAVCGLVVLIALHIKGAIIFDYRIIYSIPVILVAIPSIFNHILDIVAHKKIENIGNIVYLDLAKLSIKLLSCFVFFGKIPTTLGFIGVFIIVFAKSIFSVITKVNKILIKLF